MTLFLPGPEGRLEALYHPAQGRDGQELSEPRALSVVCHPHPAHGGTMHSTVAFRIARGLQSAGVACVRINFRGVGASEGSYDGQGGEEYDALAALDWLANKHPGIPTWAAGFSFGSRTVFGLALREERIERLVLVGFPARVYPLEGVDRLVVPALFVWGSEDEFGTLSDLRQQYPELPTAFRFEEIPGADHFFRKHTKQLQRIVSDYANQAL